MIKGIWISISFLVIGWGQQTTAQETWFLEEIVAIPDGSFVLALVDNRDGPSQLRLGYYDAEQNLQSEQVISLSQEILPGQIEGIFYWRGDLVVLSSLYYPGPQRNHLRLYRFTLPKLERKDMELISEAYTPDRYRIPFGYALSPNQDKLLLYSWSYTLPEDYARVNMQVLNNDLKPEWERRYLLPFTNDKLYLFGAAVNDGGNAYLFCENYTGRVGPRIDESRIEYFILGVGQGAEKYQRYSLNLPNRISTGLKLQMLPGNLLAGAAFYKEDKNNLSGLQLFILDTNTGQEVKQTYRIPEALYESSVLNPEIKSRYRDFENFFVDRLFVRGDGLFVVSEQRADLENPVGNSEYGEIMVVRLTPAQEKMEWMQRVPKRQIGSWEDERLFSYSLFTTEIGGYIVYNDTPRNHDGESFEKRIRPFQLPGEEVANIMIGFDKAGNWTKRDLTRLVRQNKTDLINTLKSTQAGKKLWFLYAEKMRLGAAYGVVLPIDEALLEVLTKDEE